MKPPLRTKSVGTKVSEAEFAMLEERARASGLTLSEWVRDVLLAAPGEPGAELTGEIVLAELLALRALFLNLQFRSDKGPLSEAELRGLTRQNHILHNPASELELPRLPHRLPRHVLTAQEAEQVLQQPDIHDPMGLRDRAILEVLYSTGMRRMEVISLKLYDLDTDRGTILIRLGKGKKDRFVPVGDRAVAWLEKYVREARPQLSTEPDNGTLFLAHTGEEINRDMLTMTVRAYVLKAKTGKSGACHLFRHTMATLMLEGGADVRFIQEMLGHARLDTTQIYTRVSIRMLKQIHSASHPAAMLRADHHEDGEAMLVQSHMWPGDPAPTADELFAALDSEDDDENA